MAKRKEIKLPLSAGDMIIDLGETTESTNIRTNFSKPIIAN